MEENIKKKQVENVTIRIHLLRITFTNRRRWLPVPLRQALTAGSLAFTGDTIAQLSERYRKRNADSDSGFSEVSMSSPAACGLFGWREKLGSGASENFTSSTQIPPIPPPPPPPPPLGGCFLWYVWLLGKCFKEREIVFLYHKNLNFSE